MRIVLISLLMFVAPAAFADHNHDPEVTWEAISTEEMPSVERSLVNAVWGARFRNCSVQFNNGWMNFFSTRDSRYISLITRDLPPWSNTSHIGWTAEAFRNTGEVSRHAAALRFVATSQDRHQSTEIENLVYTSHDDTRVRRVDSFYKACRNENSGTISRPVIERVCRTHTRLNCLAN